MNRNRTGFVMNLALKLLLCGTVTAGAMLSQTMVPVARDVPYAEPKNERQLLDTYARPGASKQPVVVWVHGGGWMRGSKDEVADKPSAFVERGFVFVPVNYRFVPHVPMSTIVRDAAKAVGWVHANIARHGGDPNRIFLMGHSAGAQLAALLCVDSRYIEAEKVPRLSIKGCVPVDGDTYDVPLQVATATAAARV
jgi:acetyl esterase/lipase